MPEREIILIGGGGHCRSCIDVIENTKAFKIAGIIEQPGIDRTIDVLGYPIIGSDNELDKLRGTYEFALITIGQTGSSQARQKIFSSLKKMGYALPVIVSPSANVSKHAVIGEGTVVMHQAIVNAGAVVGENCILNTRCLIEHDVCIGDHSHVSTAAVVNGGAVVGPGSFVGSNATVVQGVRLLDSQFFKAASIVASDHDGSKIRDGH